MSNNSIEDRIRDWLNSQGYPLEMYVASEFARNGFRIIQSDYYNDDDTKDSREIDLIAHVQDTIGGILLRLQFVIECKTSREKPWVLFTQDRPLADPAMVAQRGASHLGRQLVRKLAHTKAVQDLELFALPKRCAYGITQAFTTGNDVAYGAAMSVSKAAAGQINDANNYGKHGIQICLIVFPLIVIDGSLAEARLEADNSLVVSQVDSGVLVWRNRVMHNMHNMIAVVRRNEIASYASRMKQSCDELMMLAKDTVPKLVDRLDTTT